MAASIGELKISSPDFPTDERIPSKFTIDGDGELPRLTFAGAPPSAVEYALICHDPDAPLPDGFTHLTVYGIPIDATELDVNSESLRTGLNGTGRPGWFPPSPPPGHGVHRYYFWIFALRTRVVGLPTRREFIDTYADEIVEQARVVGTYSR